MMHMAFDNFSGPRFAGGLIHGVSGMHARGRGCGRCSPVARSGRLWLLVCFTAAGVGSAMTSRSLADWYPGLTKPTWNPPDWVFGPVWTLLYTMMAIAAWLVWRAAGWRGAPVPLALFATQLALNVIWSGLFFALESPGTAFLRTIVLLWLAISATLVQFWRIDRAAAALLGPYLAWVSFAAVLNFTIWQLNR